MFLFSVNFEQFSNNKDNLLSSIKKNIRLESVSSRRFEEEWSKSGIDILSKMPKISNILGVSNAALNQVKMYKMKLKLANQEIDELKAALKLVEKSCLSI